MEEQPVSAKDEEFVYLPSSFTGSPRYYSQKYLDALNMANKLDGGTFLITMTCNPLWKEIQEQLEPYETAVDRPDIVARVFKIKLASLVKDSVENHVLGLVKGFLKVIEFQKRGLPHAHIILILDPADRPSHATDIDNLVSAQIPDETTDKRLHTIVTKNMLHLCTTQCRSKDGQCTKRFCTIILNQQYMGRRLTS